MVNKPSTSRRISRKWPNQPSGVGEDIQGTCVHACCCFSHILLFAMNYNLPGSSVHGISQARILKWVAMPFSRGSSRSRDQTRTSCVSCIAGNPDSLLLSHQGSPIQGIYKALKTKLPETLCKNLLN